MLKTCRVHGREIFNSVAYNFLKKDSNWNGVYKAVLTRKWLDCMTFEVLFYPETLWFSTSHPSYCRPLSTFYGYAKQAHGQSWVWLIWEYFLIQTDEFKAQFRAEILKSGYYWHFWGQIILCICGCPVHCRIFCSISGLYPLDTRSNPFNNQKCLQILPNIPWRTKSPLNGSHWLTGGGYIGFLGREAFQRTAFMEALSWEWANHAQEKGKMLLVGMGRALHLGSSYIQGSHSD